ncbi:MFS-type transporter 1 like protein [Verticillium longisporum]|nr:MFS-type transporter 1 like protein [Verticillium longisporum]
MGLLFLVSIWLLPQDTPREKFTWPRFLREIDWIGACLISAALGITSYVLAVITGNMAKAKNAENVVMLCIAGTSAVSFGFWMHFREKSGRIALIPNSLWRKRAILPQCLFFQEVQLLSVLDAAIRFFPEVVVGILLNLLTGLFVHKINANLLITVSAALTCVAPLIMALVDPTWNFWVAAFWAALLCPFSVDGRNPELRDTSSL